MKARCSYNKMKAKSDGTYEKKILDEESMKKAMEVKGKNMSWDYINGLCNELGVYYA